MMPRIFVVLLIGLFISPGAWAVCTLTRNAPTPLNIPSQLLRISADTPVDTTTPIAQFDTPPLGLPVGYNDCDLGTEYGKRAINLIGQDPTTKIYETNIPGIGIKMLYSNGEAFGNFPSTSYLKFKAGDVKAGMLDIPPQSFYRIQFFKTSDKIRLTNPLTGDTVLPAEMIGYNYIMTDSPASFTISLSIGEMKVISTPACTADSAKSIDFNDVTPTLLKAGVTRDLDFSIVCKSDYGPYSAKASMTTTTPSSDGSTIRVTDAAGNTDRLAIQITDGTGQIIKMDGSNSEQKTGIVSQGPAEFSWKAKLIPGSKATPAGGKFSAKAEIVFDIQ